VPKNCAKPSRSKKLRLLKLGNSKRICLSWPLVDGNHALAKALKCQNEVMDEYARVLHTFARLFLYGRLPDETFEPEPKIFPAFMGGLCFRTVCRHDPAATR
jgi:hypothetical protein